MEGVRSGTGEETTKEDGVFKERNEPLMESQVKFIREPLQHQHIQHIVKPLFSLGHRPIKG